MPRLKNKKDNNNNNNKKKKKKKKNKNMLSFLMHVQCDFCGIGT
jgi:ribosomal protein S27E